MLTSPKIGVVGIAIATTTAGWVNTLLLMGRLIQLGHYRPDRRLLLKLPRLAFASATMGLLVWALASWLPSLEIHKALELVILVPAGVILFAGLGHIFGAARVSDLKAAFRRV